MRLGFPVRHLPFSLRLVHPVPEGLWKAPRLTEPIAGVRTKAACLNAARSSLSATGRETNFRRGRTLGENMPRPQHREFFRRAAGVSCERGRTANDASGRSTHGVAVSELRATNMRWQATRPRHAPDNSARSSGNACTVVGQRVSHHAETFERRSQAMTLARRHRTRADMISAAFLEQLTNRSGLLCISTLGWIRRRRTPDTAAVEPARAISRVTLGQRFVLAAT